MLEIRLENKSTNYVPGNPDLPAELVQTLLKMAPTTEEELKLRLFSGDLSQIGPAERFLKVLVETPFAFKRLECLLFMISMSEDVATVKESFTTLEVTIPKFRKQIPSVHKHTAFSLQATC